jgi:hypothetical protein
MTYDQKGKVFSEEHKKHLKEAALRRIEKGEALPWTGKSNERTKGKTFAEIHGEEQAAEIIRRQRVTLMGEEFVKLSEEAKTRGNQVCTHCKKELPPSEFYIDKSTGKSALWCKTCHGSSDRDRRLLWVKYFPKNPHCEICGKKLSYFKETIQSKAAHFDHTKHVKKYVAPYDWFTANSPTPKNVKIFQSWELGILCLRCNCRLPAPEEGRIEWLNKALVYSQRSRGV